MKPALTKVPCISKKEPGGCGAAKPIQTEARKLEREKDFSAAKNHMANHVQGKSGVNCGLDGE